MPLSNSRLSYQDCFNIFDAALEDERGVRIQCSDQDKATFLRMRMHNARKIDRKDNAEIYPEGEPMHGQSIYDKLAIRIRHVEGKVWLYVEQIALEGKIEGLSGPSISKDREPEPEPPEETVEPVIQRIARRI